MYLTTTLVVQIEQSVPWCVYKVGQKLHPIFFQSYGVNNNKYLIKQLIYRYFKIITNSSMYVIKSFLLL